MSRYKVWIVILLSISLFTSCQEKQLEPLPQTVSIRVVDSFHVGIPHCYCNLVFPDGGRLVAMSDMEGNADFDTEYAPQQYFPAELRIKHPSYGTFRWKALNDKDIESPKVLMGKASVTVSLNGFADYKGLKALVVPFSKLEDYYLTPEGLSKNSVRPIDITSPVFRLDGLSELSRALIVYSMNTPAIGMLAICPSNSKEQSYTMGLERAYEAAFDDAGDWIEGSEYTAELERHDVYAFSTKMKFVFDGCPKKLLLPAGSYCATLYPYCGGNIKVTPDGDNYCVMANSANSNTRVLTVRFLDADTGEPLEFGAVTNGMEGSLPTIDNFVNNMRSRNYKKLSPEGMGIYRYYISEKDANNRSIALLSPGYVPFWFSHDYSTTIQNPCEIKLKKAPVIKGFLENGKGVRKVMFKPEKGSGIAKQGFLLHEIPKGFPWFWEGEVKEDGTFEVPCPEAPEYCADVLTNDGIKVPIGLVKLRPGRINTISMPDLPEITIKVGAKDIDVWYPPEISLNTYPPKTAYLDDAVFRWKRGYWPPAGCVNIHVPDWTKYHLIIPWSDNGGFPVPDGRRYVTDGMLDISRFTPIVLRYRYEERGVDIPPSYWSTSQEIRFDANREICMLSLEETPKGFYLLGANGNSGSISVDRTDQNGILTGHIRSTALRYMDMRNFEIWRDGYKSIFYSGKIASCPFRFALCGEYEVKTERYIYRFTAEEGKLYDLSKMKPELRQSVTDDTKSATEGAKQ